MSDTEVLAFVREKSRAFDAKIKKRDWREMIAMGIAVPIVAVTGLSSPSWVARLGAVLVLGAFALICWKLYRARHRGASGSTLPVAEAIRSQRDKVDAQIELMETVLWWYAAPLAVGVVMVVAGGARGTGFTTVYAILVGMMSWSIYKANRRAVTGRLRPQRDELTRLLQQVGE